MFKSNDILRKQTSLKVPLSILLQYDVYWSGNLISILCSLVIKVKVLNVLVYAGREKELCADLHFLSIHALRGHYLLVVWE